MSIAKLFWLTKEDPSGREVLIWRLVVSSFMLLTVLFVVWTLGGLFSLTGFAHTGDVDNKIERALEPITLRLTSIETEQTVQGDFLKTLVKNDFARLIRNEVRARCKSTSSEEKERINAAIEKYQQDFKKAAAERYAEPACEAL